MMTLTRRTAGSARGVVRRSSMLLAAATGLLLSAEALAENTLRDISYSTLPGNRVQVSLDLEEAPEDPNSFTIDDPARITFDFPGTRNGLSERTVDVGVGLVEGVTTAEAGGRTRVVLNLADMTEYETEIEDNTFNIFVGGRDEGGSNESGSGSDTQRVGGSDAPDEAPSGSALQDIDFERGEDGTGRILVDLNEANIPVDMGRSGGEVRVVFRDAEVPEELRRRLDVVDFATPVKSIETRQDGDDTVMQIEPVEDAEYEHLGYQAGSRFTVEFQPLSEEEQEAREEQEYTGERLSLSFQDIEVRSVLQLIGDFTGLNMVVSDDVTGNITLRLQDVPWDQALDIILTTQGLDKRRNGNVILVAPAEVIAQREQQQREAEQQQEELAPLRTEFFEINYANADELAELIRAEETSLLSERGQVATDSRTNTLIVQETDSNLSDVRSMINRLDVPVRQVLIESRIVIAQDDFNKDLGVRFGASANQTIGSNDGLLFGGTQPGQQNFEQDEGSGEFNDGDSQTTGFGDEGTEGLLVDLPADGASASAGLAIGRIGDRLLQLELSAMESENRGEIISSPKVITSNQSEASIRQGVDIPFQEATASGATNVSFEEAVLSLGVTPQITPDQRIIMDLDVNQDSVGEEFNGVPSINTREVSTQVLVDNGETVVLGGIFEREEREQESRVPFFGSLPGVGWLFRNRSNVDENTELLIFVTPQILDESLDGDSGR